jgi:M6 family metalloprotease-like protein
MKSILFCTGLCLFISLLVIPVISPAALVKNFPQTVTLPDNSVIHCFSSGDEFFNWLNDENGYTLIFDKDGFLYYAIKDGDGLKPSKYRVNSIDPGSMGIQPGNLISVEAYQQRRRNRLKTGDPDDAPGNSRTPHTGTINNIVVYIRFNGEGEFTDDTSFFYNMFNSVAENANSHRRYFYEASYGQLTISSTFYPTSTDAIVNSYEDSHPRNYYQPYNENSNPSGYQDDSERNQREAALVISAFNSICGQIPVNLNMDGDGDGNIDNVCFIARGAPGLWNDLLWPHQTSVSTDTVSCHSKRFKKYTFQMQNLLYTRGNGILCHEMFHTIGAPDLYHYNDPYKVLHPVGTWDIMEDDENPPTHMSAYMKATYGLWLPSTPIISATGYYTLNPLNSASYTDVCYQINSPYNATEYFIVEYRRKTGTFESSLEDEGMLIYRINTNFRGNGGYNGSTVFDEVYAYRPGGSTTEDGYWYDANYSQLVGRTAINCTTSPTPYLTNGDPGGLYIRDITDNNGTLTFLLLYNAPANIVLNQPDTWGLWAASDEIKLQDGFDTGPSNSFGAMITGCPAPASASSPIIAVIKYEIKVLNYINQCIGSYTIESTGNIDINSIRNKPDDRGNFLSDGEYKYIISKEGAEIDKGKLVIK